LEWRREEYEGSWYFSPTYGIEGWLCPALFKYFDKAPAKFYAKADFHGTQTDAELRGSASATGSHSRCAHSDRS
ncbi:MAG: hypothetical protein ACREIA_19505, partial [Opitutaceae bacterium]